MKRNAILLAVALVAAGACNLLENPSPKEALLVVQGEAGKSVRIIVSTKFVASVDEVNQTRVVIFESDTLVTTLPYERRYRIDEDQRFFVETARLEDDLETVHMEVAIDGRVQFAEGGGLMEGQPFRFVYAFNQMVTRDIVLL